jgi:hypothetical protein
MWGVWCYSDGVFVGRTYAGEQGAIDAAAAHEKDTGHKADAKCVTYYTAEDEEPVCRRWRSAGRLR